MSSAARVAQFFLKRLARTDLETSREGRPQPPRGPKSRIGFLFGGQEKEFLRLQGRRRKEFLKDKPLSQQKKEKFDPPASPARRARLSPWASARRRLWHLPAACGGSLADMAPGAPAAAVVAEAEPDDVAMLDGNTIEVAWPQTRDGVEKMRTRVGTVYYRPKQQRNRFENVYLIEFERRPGTPRTAKGPRLRKTSWKKLRGRTYVVLSSTALPKPAGAKWTPEEIEAVRVRIDAGETHASIGRGIGRSRGSVGQCSKRFRPGYAPLSTRDGPRVKSGVTGELVERAMLTLPENEGTAVEVFEAVKRQAATDGVALNLETAPGRLVMSRAEVSVGVVLANRIYFPQFSATGEKRLSDEQIDRGDNKTKSRKTAVYKYSPPIVTAEREPGLPSTKRVRAHTPNVGGPKKSARKTKELLAGGDRRHG